MNIVVLTRAYYPNYSANSRCIGNILDQIDNNHNIIVITNESMIKTKTEKYNNHKIIRVTTRRQYKRRYIEDKIRSSSGLLKKIYILRLQIQKSLNVLKIIIKKNTIQTDLVDIYTKTLESIEQKVDVIIPVCNPIESFLAASVYIKAINTSIKLVPYLLDKFSTNNATQWFSLNKLLKFKNNLKLEYNLLKDSYKILLYHSWYNHIKKYFPEFTTKTIFIEHPLLVEPDQKNIMDSSQLDLTNSNADRRELVITFTGGLHKKIRDGKYVLRFFQEFCNKKPSVKLKLFIKGSYSGKVSKFIKKHKSCNIFNFGFVSNTRAKKAISLSDLLLLIGNNDISQLQSKVYEYMALGKPIIYTCKDMKDPIINILQKYDNFCLLMENEKNIEKNIKILDDFILSNRYKKVQFNYVSKAFYDSTPKYVSELLLDEIQ